MGFQASVLLPLLACPIKEYKIDSQSVSKNYLNNTQEVFLDGINGKIAGYFQISLWRSRDK